MNTLGVYCHTTATPSRPYVRISSRCGPPGDRFQKILNRQEVPAPVAGMFYQMVVAAVLLHGSESWVLPPSVLKVLEGFHMEVARRMTGMRPHQ